MILGITMLMVYQSISILIRNPMPLGFGGDAISAANVQIPFTIVILAVSVCAGIIISKFGNLRPSLAGTIISTLGFFSLFLFHSSELLIAENNCYYCKVYTPKDSIGISLGMTAMLFFIGMAIRPAIGSPSNYSNPIYFIVGRRQSSHTSNSLVPKVLVLPFLFV